MDEAKGSRCSTNASDDCTHARAGGIDSCSFALGEVKSGKATQVYRSNLTPRSECKSSAALQSCWVQRLNLFTSTSDAEEEGSGRKPPGKHIHVRSHFAKDFSSCRRPYAISHSRSLSWPPDGLTVNEEEEVLSPSRLPSPSAYRCDSGGPCNRVARERSSIFCDDNLLVPCEEAIQSCGVDSKTENLGLRGENRSHRIAGHPREALVPCLQNQGIPYRTNETLDAEDDCKSQNIGTRVFRHAARDSEVSLLNTATGLYFSRLETRKHLLSLFGSESITASPAVCRSDCHREVQVPSDLDAEERVLSMFASASKAYNKGARADADRRLLVSPAGIRKDQVMERPKRAAIDVLSIVDAENLNLVNSAVELGENTAVFSNVAQSTKTKDRLCSDRLSNRETSRKNVTRRSDGGKRVAENPLLFSHPCTERVRHGQSEAVEKKCGADSKPSLAFARHHATVRSCVPETRRKEFWSDRIHDFEDSGYLKPAESFSSTGSLPLDHYFEEYNLSCLKETTYSPTNDTDDWLNEWMPGLHGPLKAGVGIQSPCESPHQLSFPRLRDDSIPSREGKQELFSKENHQTGDICASSDEESCEKFRAFTSLPFQNLHFLQEAAGRMALQADNKYAAGIKHSEESLDLHLPLSKQSPKSRLCNDHIINGAPSAQQAWIQRWSSFLNAGSGSVNSLRHGTGKRGKLSSDFPEKLPASSCLGAVFSPTPSDKEKSYVGCIGQSSREHSGEGRRNMDGTVARADCGFKYIFGSCLPTRTQHVKYASPKAQALVGAARQMDPSLVKDVVFLPTENLNDLQNKGIPENTLCSTGGIADVDMDILKFLGGG